jgi:hypothetical protein
MVDFILIASIIALLYLRVRLFLATHYEEQELDVKVVWVPNSNAQHEPFSMSRLVFYKRFLEDKDSVIYDGKGRLPKKVYARDSRTITIDFVSSRGESASRPAPIPTPNTERDSSLPLEPVTHSWPDEHLEIELVADGFEIKGPQKQQQPYKAGHLRYQWPCYFPQAGKHAYALVFRPLQAAQDVEVSRVENEIEVAKIDHLTRSHIAVIELLDGVAAGCLILAEVLHYVEIW